MLDSMGNKERNQRRRSSQFSRIWKSSSASFILFPSALRYLWHAFMPAPDLLRLTWAQEQICSAQSLVWEGSLCGLASTLKIWDKATCLQTRFMNYAFYAKVCLSGWGVLCACCSQILAFYGLHSLSDWMNLKSRRQKCQALAWNREWRNSTFLVLRFPALFGISVIEIPLVQPLSCPILSEMTLTSCRDVPEVLRIILPASRLPLLPVFLRIRAALTENKISELVFLMSLYSSCSQALWFEINAN